MERRERVRGNLRAGGGDRREQGGFAGVRVADQPDLRQHPQLQPVRALFAVLAFLCKTWSLPDGRGEVHVALSPPAAGAEDELLSVLGEIRDNLRLKQFRLGLLFRLRLKIDFQRLRTA